MFLPMLQWADNVAESCGIDILFSWFCMCLLAQWRMDTNYQNYARLYRWRDALCRVLLYCFVYLNKTRLSHMNGIFRFLLYASLICGHDGACPSIRKSAEHGGTTEGRDRARPSVVKTAMTRTFEFAQDRCYAPEGKPISATSFPFLLFRALPRR